MSSPLASIIVPVYNAEKTLRRCVDSLLNQTIDDYEIILINDGSKDDSGKICDEYKSEKVIVIHKENEGVSKARNKGLDVARGKYILFCDSDDYAENNFVEVLCNYSESGAADLVCCCFNWMNIATSEIKERETGSDKPFILNKNEFLKLRELDLMACGWDKAYKASIINEKNIRFDENLSCGEDTSFTLEYLCCSEKEILVIPDRLYNYSYQLGENLAGRYTSDSFTNKFQALFNNYEAAFNALNIKKDERLTKFYTDFFLIFVKCLQNTWDKRNEFSFFKKIIYNHKIVASKEFKKCYDNMDKSKFVKLYLTVMKSKCALLILAFLKLSK